MVKLTSRFVVAKTYPHRYAIKKTLTKCMPFHYQEYEMVLSKHAIDLANNISCVMFPNPRTVNACMHAANHTLAVPTLPIYRLHNLRLRAICRMQSMQTTFNLLNVVLQNTLIFSCVYGVFQLVVCRACGRTLKTKSATLIHLL